MNDEQLLAILSEYNAIERDDVRACLLFASRALSDTEFMPLMAESA